MTRRSPPRGRVHRRSLPMTHVEGRSLFIDRFALVMPNGRQVRQNATSHSLDKAYDVPCVVPVPKQQLPSSEVAKSDGRNRTGEEIVIGRRCHSGTADGHHRSCKGPATVWPRLSSPPCPGRDRATCRVDFRVPLIRSHWVRLRLAMVGNAAPSAAPARSRRTDRPTSR